MNYDEHVPLSTTPEHLALCKEFGLILIMSAPRLKVQGKFYSLVYLCKAYENGTCHDWFCQLGALSCPHAIKKQGRLKLSWRAAISIIVIQSSQTLLCLWCCKPLNRLGVADES